MSPAITDATSSRAAWLTLVAVGALIGAATWFILGPDDAIAAGSAVAGVGAAVALSGVLAKRSPAWASSKRWWFVDAVLDRAFDGAVLGAVAWSTRATDPAVCAGALVAIGAGFLGSYVRARGASLGYRVEEGRALRVLRAALIAVGLLADVLSWTVWVVAAASVLAALVRSSQVLKEERV